MPKRDFQIRRLELQDVPAVLQIISACRLEYGAASPVSALLESSDLALFDASRRRRAVYYVALVGDEVVGGAGISRLVEGDYASCELKRLYLKASYRRSGIGQALLNHCLQMARQFDYQRCYAETDIRMAMAIAFYERQGFSRMEDDHRWYSLHLPRSAVAHL